MGMENGEVKKNRSIVGNRYGRLTVLSAFTRSRRSWLRCLCDCGEEKTVRRDHVVSGRVVSCGCYGKALGAERNRTHGKTGTRLYRIWKDMRNRCGNKKVPGYHLWGGRGISVCNEWTNFETFRGWAESSGYADNLSLDRIDNDGDYTPDNCRWATPKEQSLNRRSNCYITCNGVTKHISEWDKGIGATKSGRVRSRLNAGWSVEQAVTTPVTKGR